MEEGEQNSKKKKRSVVQVCGESQITVKSYKENGIWEFMDSKLTEFVCPIYPSVSYFSPRKKKPGLPLSPLINSMKYKIFERGLTIPVRTELPKGHKN